MNLRYVILVFVITLIASPQLVAAQVADEYCSKFIDLVYSERYNDARSLLFKNDSAICDNSEYKRAMAMLLSAELNFSEAIEVLQGLLAIHPDDVESQRLLQKCYRMLPLSRSYKPVSIIPCRKLNTQSHEIIAWASNQDVVVLTDTVAQIQYLPIKSKVREQMRFAPNQNGSQAKILKTVSRKLFKIGVDEPGPACFLPDSTLIITVKKRIPYSKPGDWGSYELLSFELEPERITSLFHQENGASDAFPAYRSTDSILVFSSNRVDGSGEMDLWFSQKNGKKWNEPVNAGPKVNSIRNEVFCTFFGDSLIFASNRNDIGFGGYDLYVYSFSGDSIWNLGLPINSSYDDHSLLQVAPGEAYMVSSRPAGKGLSDIYKVKWSPKEQYFNYIEGEIVNSRNLTGEEVVLLNSEGSIIQRSVVDKKGKFILKHVKGIETYRIDLSSSKFNKEAELKLYDSEENLIKHVKSAGEKGFFFELLTPKDYYMEPLNLVDESILAVDVIGKLFMNNISTPKGFKIILTDSDGDVLANSQATAGGEFLFEHVRPDTEYRIRSEVKNALSSIYILDGQGNILQTIEPGADGDFVFVRLSENDQVVTITNEIQQVVKISDSELFNLGSIQYEYNRAMLSSAGIGILEKIVEILLINLDVSVELSGHTDAKGSLEYNQNLSERRIVSAIEYLLSMGVERSRISGKAYGESRLLNHCKDDDDCLDNEHAVNRRTELRIFYPER